MSEQLANIFRRNAEHVESQIAQTCERAGRARASVKLVAVSKYVTPEVAQTFVDVTRITDLGESRPQELVRKAKAVASVTWHQIGHVQRNKVRDVVPVASLIHTADSVRLLEAYALHSVRVPVLIEVNVSGEEAKHGFAPAELPALADVLGGLTHVEVRGLMTMAALGSTPAQAQRTFADLRELRDDLAGRLGRELPELSMGMSNDYEEAIAEGSTIVRIGSSLFAGAM